MTSEPRTIETADEWVLAIDSPRSKESHWRLAAALVASAAAAGAARSLSAAVRDALRYRLKGSSKRRAEAARALRSQTVRRLIAAHRASHSPLDPVPARILPARRIDTDPIIRALASDPALRQLLGPVSPTKTEDSSAWVEVERDHVTHRAVARLSFKGARDTLVKAAETARPILVAIGFRVAFADVFRLPKYSGHVATFRLEPIRTKALAI